MEARIVGARQAFAAFAALTAAQLLPSALYAAAYQTTNFTVDAPTPQLAKEIGDAAEVWREQLAVEWLGAALPRWAEKCPIKARVSPHLGAGGATSFIFDRGDVFGWRMNVQGSRERVLDSVLPHEITHTIFASHFRQPLPRWADEGACTTVEHRSEIAKQERMLIDFLKVRPGHPGRGIPFNDMFVMTEYPEDVLPLYAQGHSLSVFLIGHSGKREFLSFLADGMTDGDWRRAVREHYGFEHLLALQTSWLDWVKAGRPALSPASNDGLLAATPPAPPAELGAPASMISVSTPVVRGQSPAGPPPAPRRPSPDDSAANADWATRPARNSLAIAQDAATASGVWR